MSMLLNDIQHLLNYHSRENESDTPDFLLAEYLMDCLRAYEKIIKARDKWYDFQGLSSRHGGKIAMNSENIPLPPIIGGTEHD